MSEPAFRRLVASDEAVVRGWLQPYLEQHAAWWLAGRGLDDELDAAEIVRRRGLVTRDWIEFLSGVDADPAQRLVDVAEIDGRPAGMVAAAIRPDQQLGLRGGVLQWLTVDPAHRGSGLARRLLTRATDWFDLHDVRGAELFVTVANPAATRLYEQAGFAPVDHRMFRPARS